MRSSWRRGAAAAAVGLAGWAVAACGASTDRAAPSSAPAGGGGGGAPAQVAPLDGARQVISTATLRIEVDDVAAAAARAGQVATEHGGFVAGSNESGTSSERRAEVTLKVPNDRFDRVVGAVSGLGEVRTKRLGTEDVTDQVVDLEARLRAGRAAAERLQQLIARSASVAEVVAVEAELSKRTAEIESLEGRLRVLRDKVDLATVTATFTRPAAAAGDDLPGFLSGLRGGWRALRGTAILASAALGALLPWLVPAALLAFGARTGWRAWRRRHPPRPRPAPPSQWVGGGHGAGAPPPPVPQPVPPGPQVPIPPHPPGPPQG